MSGYYDMDGNPMELMEWAEAFEKSDRIIGLTEADGVRVSTVWLGNDHNFFDDGPPLIFETMIFGGPHDQDQWRYSTREQALEGHEAAHKVAFG